MTILNIQNLSKQFHDKNSGPVKAIENLSLDVQTGQFVSVIGPSGCGKTTLLRIIAGLDRASEGSIHINAGSSVNVGFVFQEYALFPWLTVQENIGFGLRFGPGPPSENISKIRQYIKRFDLEDFANSFPNELSGGMKQRVAIARTLICDPAIILMDEPFGALDSQTRAKMQEFLQDLWTESGKTILFVTHNVDEAIFLSNRIIGLTRRPGKIGLRLPVDLSIPRNITSDKFNCLRGQILSFLNSENR